MVNEELPAPIVNFEHDDHRPVATCLRKAEGVQSVAQTIHSSEEVQNENILVLERLKEGGH